MTNWIRIGTRETRLAQFSLYKGWDNKEQLYYKNTCTHVKHDESYAPHVRAKQACAYKYQVINTKEDTEF